MQKIEAYKISDGRIFETKEQAVQEQLELDISALIPEMDAVLLRAGVLVSKSVARDMLVGADYIMPVLHQAVRFAKLANEKLGKEGS